MRLYLQFILRYFKYGKKRSFSSNAINLATIGLAIGVFSLLVTISVIKGFENVLSNKLVNVDGKIRLKTIFGSSISEFDRIDSTLVANPLGDSKFDSERKRLVRKRVRQGQEDRD